jgi:hypothetical protein
MHAKVVTRKPEGIEKFRKFDVDKSTIFKLF